MEPLTLPRMGKSTSPGGKSNRPGQLLITCALLVVIIGGLGLVLWPEDPARAPARKDGQLDSSAAATNAAVATAPDVSSVLGNWLREDGGYQLRLTRDPDGEKLRAEYFNPQPINVSFASATNDSGTLKLRVELRDVNYPGCVYTLVHDRSNDRLLGTYFQAAMNQTFEVVFVRMPDPATR
jgi:hypothetical protein